MNRPRRCRVQADASEGERLALLNKKKKKASSKNADDEAPDLKQRVMQLEIENKRLREQTESENASGRFTPTEIIVLGVVLVLVFGGGYAIGRHVFHLNAWMSILAAPLLCLLLILAVALANFFDLF